MAVSSRSVSNPTNFSPNTGTINHANATATPNANINVNANAANPRYSTAFSSLRSSARRITNSLSPVKHIDPHVSLEKDFSPRFSTDRSSSSSRSSQQTALRPRAASSSTASLSHFSDQKITPQNPIRHQTSASATFPTRSPQRGLRRVDGILPLISRASTASSILHPSAHQSSGSVVMTAASQPNLGFGPGAAVAPLPGSGLSTGYVPAPPGSLQNPNVVYQHIHDTASKRISTLDYLRKA